jgi:hypothetical protein
MFYQRAKFKLEVPYILDSTKMTKSDFGVLKICTVHATINIRFFQFTHSEYKVIRVENLPVCTTQHCLHVNLVSDVLIL